MLIGVTPWMRALLLASVLAGSAVAAARGDDVPPLKGVALVIGESNYSGATLPRLANPRNDARAMDDLLSDLGFDVTRVLDGDGHKLGEAIDDFVADAKTADVALVYYSGHGIEAGGENYLAPTDADLSNPQRAGQTLVPLSAVLDRLARAVPVTIMLLDACRTSAFPAGTMIQPPGAPQPIPAVENGLAEVRGPNPVAAAGVPPTSLGMVIGFAASPGRPALDGDPDGNSPYAAALLKHLGAGGYSFADLMTMVSEEVYLKTRAQQLPWTNSSLRRVLSFGTPPDEGDADDRAIKEGRRQLLLTIAQEPQETRSTVEAIAAGEGVPLDALYGMLKVLGVDTSGGAADLEKQLEEGASQLKSFKEQELGSAATDPELKRLAELAGRAQDEGAIELALKYREQATARARVLSSARDTLEQGLKADRIEIARTFADHGQTAALNFDYQTAAQMFGEAYDQVAKWDDDLALTYKRNEAQALRDYGDFKPDKGALQRSVDAYKQALLLAPRDGRPQDWMAISTNLGWALQTLGERQSDDAALSEAVDVLQGAIADAPPGTTPADLAVARLNLGNVVSLLGQRESDPSRLQQSVAIYREALAALGPGDPEVSGKLQFNLATTLRVMGERSGSDATLKEALAAFEAALSVIARPAHPLEWAQVENNYATALYALGDRTHDMRLLDQAAAALNLALEEDTEDRVPLDWAMAQGNLGNIYARLADETGDVATLRRGIDALKASLRHITPGTAAGFYATAQSNLGTALESLSEKTGDRNAAGEAVAALNAALEIRTEQNDPPNWALTQLNLSLALTRLGSDEVSPLHVQQAADAARAALRHWTRNGEPMLWARAQYALATALQAAGNHETGGDSLTAAEAAFEAALGIFDRDGHPAEWLVTTKRYAFLEEALGERMSTAPNIARAAEAYRQAIAASAGGDPVELARLNFNLGISLINLDAYGAQADGFERAADAFRAALVGYSRDASPADWAESQFRLGYSLQLAANKLPNAGIDELRGAVAAYQAAQQVRSKQSDPFGWAEIETYLGAASGVLGVRSNDRAMLQQGRDQLQAAWDVYKTRDDSYDANFEQQIRTFDEKLAAMN